MHASAIRKSQMQVISNASDCQHRADRSARCISATGLNPFEWLQTILQSITPLFGPAADVHLLILASESWLILGVKAIVLFRQSHSDIVSDEEMIYMLYAYGKDPPFPKRFNVP